MQRNNFPKLRALCANRISHTLFAADDHVVRERLAPVLLQHIIDANWLSVELMLIQDPLLMFEIVGAEEVNDLRLPAGAKVSSLDYICMMRDRYSLNICKSVLRPDLQAQYSEIVRSYPIVADVPTHTQTIGEEGFLSFQAMVELWLRDEVTIEDLQTYLVAQAHQLTQQNQIYCLQPFYWVCEESGILCQRRAAADPLVTDAKANEFLQKIDGFAKRHLMPGHQLKLIQARENDNGRYVWEVKSDFAEEKYPINTGCLLETGKNFTYVSVDPGCDKNPAYICGENYSVVRGSDRRMAYGASCNTRYLTGILWTDLETFRRLDCVRRAEFICEQLELEAAHAPLKIMGSYR